MPTFTGVVRGRTIELIADPGIADGASVEVSLQVLDRATPWGAGLMRCAGVLADEWDTEDDSFLEEIQETRQRASFRDDAP